MLAGVSTFNFATSICAMASADAEPMATKLTLPPPSTSTTSSSSSSSSFENDDIHYDWTKSTEDNYRATTTYGRDVGGGPFAHLRERLDYSFHAHYSIARRFQQDTIIKSMLNATWLIDSQGNLCSTPNQPWIVFTAGAMGSGKSWTIRKLAQEGLLPLDSFVTVDPDDIRRALPEFDGYVKRNASTAGELTRKEAGFLAELIVLAALERGQNVLVDGSLRDAVWYHRYFMGLRRNQPRVRIAILYVTAPREAVFRRAEARATATGRVVPRRTLEEALEQVPKSVEVLRPLTDFYAELYNAPEADNLELRNGMTWDTFKQNWAQHCSNDKTKTECPSKL